MNKLALFGSVALGVVLFRKAFSGGKDPVIRPMALEAQVMRYSGLIWRLAVKYDVDPAMIAAIMAAESSGIHQGARKIPVISYEGRQDTDYVVGLMQIRLDTAGRVCDIWDKERLEIDSLNVECAVKYLGELFATFLRVDRTVSAYNAGAGSVSPDISVPVTFVNLPYVKKVLGMIPRFRLLFMSIRGGDLYLSLFPGWKWRFDTT